MPSQSWPGRIRRLAALTSVSVRNAALSWVASNTQASDRTRAEYRRTLDRYLPEGDPFGDWPAGVVKHSDVRKWIRRLQDRQVETKGADPADTPSAKTIRNVHSVVSAGFDLLLRDGDIPSNPALGAAPSLGDKPNDHVLTVAEYRALLSYIPLHYRPLIETLVRTGSRWGEATALLVGDVNPDADNPRIRIDKAWTEGDRRGQYKEGTPKKQRGYRSAAISRGDKMRLRLLGCVHRKIPSQNPMFAPPSHTLNTIFMSDSHATRLRSDSIRRLELRHQ